MKPITKELLIAVEGKDEVNFFNALLKSMGISNYQIEDIVGKTQYKEKIPALIKTTGFEKVRIFFIIRDANDDAQAAFDNIKNILLKQNLKPPDKTFEFGKGNPKIGIYIMPGKSESGMLEDLCLKTVEKHPAMKCVDTFIKCVERLENPPKNFSKAKAQAFLAAMPEIVNSTRLGAEKGYWNFESEELKELKTFLKIIE